MRVILVVEGITYSRLGGWICKHVMLDITFKICSNGLYHDDCHSEYRENI